MNSIVILKHRIRAMQIRRFLAQHHSEDGSTNIRIRFIVVGIRVHTIRVQIPNIRKIPGFSTYFHTLFRSGRTRSQLQRTMHGKHDVAFLSEPTNRSFHRAIQKASDVKNIPESEFKE